MPALEAVMPSADVAAYLVNVAVVVSLVSGVGLLAARVCRRGSAPLLHGILVWALVLILVSPVAVWLAQQNGLALVRITVPDPSGTLGTAIANPSLPAPTYERAGECEDSAGRYGGSHDFIAEMPTPGPGLEGDGAGSAVSLEESQASAGQRAEIPSAARRVAATAIEERAVLRLWQAIGSIVALLWALGTALGLLRLAWGYVALVRFCRRLDPLMEARQKLLVHQAADAVGLRKLPAVYLSHSAGVPMSIGLLRPAIVLPEAMLRGKGDGPHLCEAPEGPFRQMGTVPFSAEVDEEQLQAILLHEMAHIARRDPWVGVGQRIAAALFWWNPLVHWTCEGISDLREEICDNHVVLVQGEGQRLARILVDLAARVTMRPLLPSTIGVMEPRLAGLTGRVTRLLDKERSMETRIDFRSMVFLFSCGLVALIAMATVGGLRLVCAQTTTQASLSEAKEPSQNTADVGAKTGAAPGALTGEPVKVKTTADDAQAEQLEFRGHVVGPDGKPVRGAKLYLLYFTSAELPPPPVRAVSGPDGSFHFSVAKADFHGRGEAHEPWLISGVVAVADNLGMGWQTGAFLCRQIAERAKSEPGYSLEAIKKMVPEERLAPIIRLVRDDVPITGRIVAADGQPVAGATVRLLEIQTSFKNDLTAWLAAVEKEKADYYQAQVHIPDGLTGHLRRQLPYLLPAATTDQDGRFRLLGIGRERIVRLQLEGPGIATARLNARTRPGPTLQIIEQANATTRQEPVVYYGASFDYAARPSRPVVGMVCDKDARTPLAGVTIESYKLAGNPLHGFGVDFVRTKTDEQGRYRLTGLPIGEDNKLMVVPRLDGPYLLSWKPADTRPERNAIEINFELKRGVIIHGRVTDAVTGKPVSAQIDYYVFTDNPHSASAPGFRGVCYGNFGNFYQTDQNGQYRIPGLPGRGIVTVLAHNHERYSRGAGAEKIKGSDSSLGLPAYKTEPGWCMPGNFHMLAEVNPSEEAKQTEADFVLDPHQRVEGTVVDPDGKPLSDAVFSGQIEHAQWRPFFSGKFIAEGYQPDKPRTLLFAQHARKLAGSFVLKGPQPSPITVRLEPWGEVTGRLVDDHGKPQAEVTIVGGGNELPPQSIIDRMPGPSHVQTGRDGRFHIIGLASGVSYELAALQTVPLPNPQLSRTISQIASDVVVQSGQTRDLGNLTLKPLNLPTGAQTPAAAKTTKSPRLSGVVRRPDGATVAGADVYLEAGEPRRRARKLMSPALPIEERAKRQLEPKPIFRIIARTQSDAAGRFSLELQSPPTGDQLARIIVAAKHSGLAVQSWDGKATELEIRLPPMVVIEGRLLTPDRGPATDVVVKATVLSRGENYDELVDPFLDEKDYPPYWPRPVRSNAEGAFTLDGVPAGCHLILDLTHPSFAREEVQIDTGQGTTEGSRGFEIPLLPSTFTHVLEPSRPVEGVVTAADTGKPLAGVLVNVIPMDRHGGMGIYTRTDAAGHFRVSDKAGEHYFITVAPKPDSGYLAEEVGGERWPQGAKSLVQDFQLARGVLLQGRVFDDASGKPIPSASVEYHASLGNPNRKTANRKSSYEFRNSALTDDEGRFKLTGLGGSGHLTVETLERAYLRKPLTEKRSPMGRAMPMGYTPIDLPPPAGSNQEVTIRLQRGRTVTLQAVGPNGERLPSAVAAWEGRDALHEEIWNHGESFPEGKIIVRGVDPNRITRVFMIDAEKKIGAAYDITAKTPEGPVEVRLQPNATITGQAVGEDGEPADVQASLRMCFDPEIKRLSTSQRDIFRYQFYSNFSNQHSGHERIPGGRFSFDNVLPGIPLSVTVAESGERSRTVNVEPLQPGERRDLGRVVLKKRR